MQDSDYSTIKVLSWRSRANSLIGLDISLIIHCDGRLKSLHSLKMTIVAIVIFENHPGRLSISLGEQTPSVRVVTTCTAYDASGVLQISGERVVQGK